MSKQFSTLIDALAENAVRYRNHRALVLPVDSSLATFCRHDFGTSGIGKSITWYELACWVFHLASELRREVGSVETGLPGKGMTQPLPEWNRVAMPVAHEVNNTPEDLIFALGCQAAGFLEVPVDVEGGPHYKRRCRQIVGGHWVSNEQKLEFVLAAGSQCEKVAGSSGSEYSPTLRSKFWPSSDLPALLLWTSGTSGDPKGVVLSHQNLLCNAIAKLRAAPQKPIDRRLTLLSIAHAYARTSDIGTWILSACTIGIAKGFDGWRFWSGWFDPTHCNMVPSLASRVLDVGTLPTSFAVVGCGGAAMSEAEFQCWRDSNITVIQGYGLTEAGPVIASQSPDSSIAGHVGRIVQGWEWRIDEQRLFVRGAAVMLGYWNAPSTTAERIDRDGWLDTGDLVQVSDVCGQLKILGRADDRIILANGHNVDPHQIEMRICAIPEVRTAFLRACADERSVELWIESEDGLEFSGQADTEQGIVRRSDEQQQRLYEAVRQFTDALPHWASPRKLMPLAISPQLRRQLFNRKGAVRRAEMERYIQSLASP